VRETIRATPLRAVSSSASRTRLIGTFTFDFDSRAYIAATTHTAWPPELVAIDQGGWPWPRRS